MKATAGRRLCAFTVSLSAVSGQVVEVGYATAAGTATVDVDYQSVDGVLTFNPGDTAKTVTVLVNGDTLSEANETFTVQPVLATARDTVQPEQHATGTIVDDDVAPTISIANASVTEGNVSTRSVVFTVGLSTASGQQVTVDYATADGTATEDKQLRRPGSAITCTARTMPHLPS